MRILGDNLDDSSTAQFGDNVTILNCCEERYETGESYAKTAHATNQVNLTRLEADYLASNGHEGAQIMFGAKEGKTTLMDREEGFGYFMNTHEKFTGRKKVSARLELIRRALQRIKKIEGNIQGHSIAHELVRHTLREVSTQLTRFLAFMEDWTQEMVQQCGYLLAVAWLFIGIVSRAILDHMLPPRLEVAEIMDIKDNRLNKARLIWSILQVHIRFNEIMDADFKAHQVVITAQSNYIMKSRVDPSRLDEVDKKFKLQDELTVASNRRLASLENELKTAKTTISQNSKYITNLKAKANARG